MNFFRRVKHYIHESYVELMQKVSWPSWSELQNSAIIVMVATAILAIVVVAIDLSFKTILTGIYNIFN